MLQPLHLAALLLSSNFRPLFDLSNVTFALIDHHPTEYLIQLAINHCFAGIREVNFVLGLVVLHLEVEGLDRFQLQPVTGVVVLGSISAGNCFFQAKITTIISSKTIDVTAAPAQLIPSA